MSEFLDAFFNGALGGVIFYSASMVVKTIYERTIERASERFEKERAKKARDQKIISLLGENISLLEENLSLLEEKNLSQLKK